jgi:hypothetical protein
VVESQGPRDPLEQTLDDLCGDTRTRRTCSLNRLTVLVSPRMVVCMANPWHPYRHTFLYSYKVCEMRPA